MKRPYEIELTKEEHHALAWLSSRYESAEALYGAMQAKDEEWDSDNGPWPMTFTLAEHEAWEFQEALEHDEGMIPCFGSMGKVYKLIEGIV